MSSYHRLPIAEKRALDLSRVRESAITCPICDTQVMPADMEAHLDTRCDGPREPGPGAKWVLWRDALRLVPKRTLNRWVKRGYVRIRGGRGDREYFLRDLVVRTGLRRLTHRR